MRRAALVPAGWGAYNGLWVAILAGLGGSAIPLWLYGGAVGLVELFAGAFVLSLWKRNGASPVNALPVRGDISIVAAAGVVLTSLASALGPWLYPPGGATLLWALALFVLDIRSRRLSQAP